MTNVLSKFLAPGNYKEDPLPVQVEPKKKKSRCAACKKLCRNDSCVGRCPVINYVHVVPVQEQDEEQEDNYAVLSSNRPKLDYALVAKAEQRRLNNNLYKKNNNNNNIINNDSNNRTMQRQRSYGSNHVLGARGQRRAERRAYKAKGQ